MDCGFWKEGNMVNRSCHCWAHLLFFFFAHGEHPYDHAQYPQGKTLRGNEVVGVHLQCHLPQKHAIKLQKIMHQKTMAACYNQKCLVHSLLFVFLSPQVLPFVMC